MLLDRELSEPRPPAALASLDAVPVSHTIGVIISLNTRVFTTLAVASAARHLRIPLLIVECQSRDGSDETLSQLPLPVASWMVRRPRETHGKMIDRLIRHLRCERVLLIDSDVDVRDSNAYQAMKAAMDTPQTPIYAAGRGCGGHDMSHDGMPSAWFLRRSWIPFVLLDRQRCLDLINRGVSFDMVIEGNEFPVRWIADLLARRARYRATCGWELAWLKPFRKTRYDRRAPFYFFDTGAKIHEAAAESCLGFADIGHAAMMGSVEHFTGATRRAAKTAWAGASDVEQSILQKLSSDYGIELNS